MIPKHLAVITILAFASCAAEAGRAVSHHGGPILHCEPPVFFDETPGKEAKVPVIQDFSVTASDNTDAETIKLWANNEPVEVKITQERSGRLLIQGRLKEPVARGRVWFRVTADSHDGCDQWDVWNVYAGN
ncbi:MAG: hypothetical protein PHE55_20100 [Methylococcaceae bacterium]|nr:hypothetical protein [Methylococcaceae bacterium]